MSKAFASQGDLTEKKITFDQIGDGVYAFTAEGDPNTGVIIGDESVMIVEAQATPRLARKVIDCVRSVTDKPISHLVLTHYHAVRVLGASAYSVPVALKHFGGGRSSLSSAAFGQSTGAAPGSTHIVLYLGSTSALPMKTESLAESSKLL
jgi:glyoxylase-like metal-dependent hydrolase (beta-lactamase superfamily II)